LSQNLGKAELARRLLEYAEQTLQIDQLLELAKARNPAIYEKYKPYYEYLSSGSRDLMGKNLGKYHIIERLGQGGMADVYKAYQPGLARYVAIKIIHSHLADNEEFIERFESEAMAVAGLRHSNIVQVIDFDREDERCYMVMEFVAGHTLETELKNRKAEGQLFPLNEIVDIFNSLASAIDYAHSRGVIHRDLKPGNIMFTSRRRIVLTDFGIARITSIPSYTMSSAVIGTPAYMSPEQATGQGVDERSDIYSMGVILYELVTGRIPFEGDNPLVIMMNLINGAYPAPTTINPELPETIEQVILRAMSKGPDDRYQGAGEMAQALQAAVEMAGNPGLLTRRVDTAAFKEFDKRSDIHTGAVVQARDNRPDQAKDQALQKAAWPEIEIPSSPPRQIDDTGRQPEKRGRVITISGNSGQVVIDSAHNAQVGDIYGEQVSVGGGMPQASLPPETRETSQAVLQRMLTNLKARLEIEAPAEKKEAALERLIELEEAITAARPDLDTISYVKNWFGKHIPNLAGAVANLISHPLIEKLYRGY
jgi:serine/threonine-protein kinase